MHREFDATADPLVRRSAAGLYLFTAIAAGLLIADLIAPLTGFLQSLGLDVSLDVPREFYGFRFALLAAILGGGKSLYNSLERLLEGKFGADLAVVLACAAAIVLGEPVVAAEVVVIGLVGECLEAFTFDRAQNSVRKLTELFPLRCWRLNADGTEERIFTTQLAVDDTVIVKPGGKIPADGIVTAGQAAVDQAALTGESVPIEKSVGDTVLAGAIVPSGALTFRVTNVASQTVAGQVVELTAKALALKGDGERLADRLARWFLPVVLGVALLTFAFNVAINLSGGGPETRRVGFNAAARVAAYPTLAVLVVACPCPLVLATPAAVVAALGRLAGTGILLKSGAALERLATVQGFAFDKTGTLTRGVLEVVELHPTQDGNESELLRVAATAEALSEHPIAAAILRAAAFRTITWPIDATLEARPGAGVKAVTPAGDTLLVGTPAYLEREGIAVPLPAEAGLTLVAVARNGFLLGTIGLRDDLRPEAVGVVSDLAALGLGPLAVLSGDRPEAVQGTLGNVPGLTLFGGLLPSEKAEWLAAQAKPMGYIGDGINDAPALASASVGVAVGTGADIAAAAGDVILMGEPLRSLPFLVRLSREAVKTIRFNIIGFGFALNTIGVVLTGWLWPLFATTPAWFEQAPLAGAIFHQLGSLLVLLNSMRLLGFERAGTSRTMTSLKDAGRTLDRRLSAFHFDDLLHEAVHHWRKLAAAVVILALPAWLASGVTIVAPQETAVVQRFGRIDGDVGPGLHYRRPWPFETVTRFRPQEVRTVEIGFRLLPEERAAALELAAADQARLRGDSKETPSLTWGSAHAGAFVPKVEESLLITGDGNLVELFATVRYRIAEPRVFLERGRDPEALIRSAAESAFRELASAYRFQDVLTIRRGEFEERAAARFAARFIDSAPERLGLEITGLTIHDLHPPQEVVASFHAVAEAIQKRDREVNLAEGDALRLRRRAVEEAVVLLNRTASENADKIAEAEAARDVFAAWAAGRRELPAEMEAALRQDEQRRLAAGEDRAKVTAETAAKRAEQVQTRRALTEFRLMLDAVTLALRGRDKILIDAEGLPGKRHILLMDPDAPGARLPPIAFPRPEAPKP